MSNAGISRFRGAARPWMAGVVVAALASIAAPGSASADFIFDLNTGNSAISGFTGPYAQVDVHLTDSTHATIIFTGLIQGSNNYMFGGAGAVGVNVNGAATIGPITGTNDGAGFTPGPLSDAGAGNEDGFGSFNHSIDSFDGYGSASDVVTFTLTKSSGSWASDTDVLTANASGDLAAAHIFVSPSNNFSGSGALATGFAAGAAAPPPPPHFDVPEPASLAITGLALLGMGLVRRRKRIA